MEDDRGSLAHAVQTVERDAGRTMEPSPRVS